MRVPRPSVDRAFGGDRAAMRLHDALGDGKAEAGALAAIGAAASPRARTNFSNTRGSASAGMPGPSSVTRSATRSGVDVGVDHDTACPGGVCAMALPTTLPSACSTSVASARTSGRSAGRSTSNVLTRAAPPRRAHDAVDDLAQVDPVAAAAPARRHRSGSWRAGCAPSRRDPRPRP